MRAAQERKEDGTRRINPSNYFEAGEVSILRAYFGLKLRKGDPPLESLYADEETTGPIRLWTDVGDEEPITALSNAVARICLTDAQERLPQWAVVDVRGNTILARPQFERADRLLPLEPERLLCINWADSGPGFSWPEDYYVTFLPGFGRYVVTASSDSTDSYGVTDFAIGFFGKNEDIVPACQAIVQQWWQQRADDGHSAWEYLFNEGLIDEEAAEEMRASAWGGEAERWE
jgi:hypothetical protein